MALELSIASSCNHKDMIEMKMTIVQNILLVKLCCSVQSEDGITKKMM